MGLDVLRRACRQPPGDLVVIVLSPGNATTADEAIQRVEAAAMRGDAAVAGMSQALSWIIGAGSSYDAAVNDAAATLRILDDLRARRPDLTDDGLPGFLELAAAGASIAGLQATAAQLAPQAFADQVVKPTVAQAGAAFAGLGAAALVGLAVVAVIVYLPRGRP